MPGVPVVRLIRYFLLAMVIPPRFNHMTEPPGEIHLSNPLFQWCEYTRFEGHTEEQIGYHASLCVEAGFLKCSADMLIVSLTWAGHEELAQWRAQASHNC